MSLDEVVERSALQGAEQAYSGSRLERVQLADGRVRVLKHLPPEGDWLTRATDGRGRTRRLWDRGLLDRVGETVDHAVVDVVRADGRDVVVMEDVGDALIPPGSPVPKRQAERLLAGFATLHSAWEGCEIAGLCTPAARYGLFAPAFHASDEGPGTHPLRDVILDGWDVFAEAVPADVAGAVDAVHADPERLGAELAEAAPPTLLHGDAKLENLGLRGDRLVAVDWGELTGVGPAEVDLAWFALQGTWRIDATPDALFAAYATHAERRLDPRALDLACIGSLAQMGFKMAYRSVHAADAEVRARASTLLAWWADRVQEALAAVDWP